MMGTDKKLLIYKSFIIMKDFFKKLWIVIRACCDCKLNAEEEEVLFLHPWALRMWFAVSLFDNQYPKNFDCRKIFELPLDKIVAVLTIACKRDHNIMWKPEVQSNIFKLPAEYAEKFGMWIITNAKFDEDAQSDMLTVAENDGEKGLPLEVVIRLVRACTEDVFNKLHQKARKKLVELLAKYPDNEDLIELVLKYKSDGDVQCSMLTVADDENKEGLPLDLAIRLVCATIENGQGLCSKAFRMLLALVAKYPDNEDLINRVIKHIVLWHEIDPESENAMLTVAKDSNSEGLPFGIVLRLVEEFVPIGREFHSEKAQKKLFRLLLWHPECERLKNLVLEYASKHSFAPSLHMSMLRTDREVGEERGLPLDFALRLFATYTNWETKTASNNEELNMAREDLIENRKSKSRLCVDAEKLMLCWLPCVSSEFEEHIIKYIEMLGLQTEAADALLEAVAKAVVSEDEDVDMFVRILTACVERNGNPDFRFSYDGVIELFKLAELRPELEKIAIKYVKKNGLSSEQLKEVFSLPKELQSSILKEQAEHGFPEDIKNLMLVHVYQEKL